MALDRSFVERNRQATQRMRDLVQELSDDDLKRPVGEHWTVAVTLAHIAFWDERVLALLDATEREGKAFIHTIDIIVNDIALPLLRAIPPNEAVRIALETAEKLDNRLDTFSPELLAQIHAVNSRFINRYVHRGEHLDEIEQALNV